MPASLTFPSYITRALRVSCPSRRKSITSGVENPEVARFGRTLCVGARLAVVCAWIFGTRYQAQQPTSSILDPLTHELVEHQPTLYDISRLDTTNYPADLS